MKLERLSPNFMGYIVVRLCHGKHRNNVTRIVDVTQHQYSGEGNYVAVLYVSRTYLQAYRIHDAWCAMCIVAISDVIRRDVLVTFNYRPDNLSFESMMCVFVADDIFRFLYTHALILCTVCSQWRVLHTARLIYFPF